MKRMAIANQAPYLRSLVVAFLFAAMLFFLLSSSVQRIGGISLVLVESGILRRRTLLSGICSESDISILQEELNPLPDGTPTFGVQIVNLCPAECSVGEIHVACGWFASAKLVNPHVFRRLGYNDCLVNDGEPLREGESVYFEYSNTFEYSMSVEAAVACK